MSEFGLLWSHNDSVLRTGSEPAKWICGGTATQSHVCNPQFSYIARNQIVWGENIKYIKHAFYCQQSAPPAINVMSRM